MDNILAEIFLCLLIELLITHPITINDATS